MTGIGVALIVLAAFLLGVLGGRQQGLYTNLTPNEQRAANLGLAGVFTAFTAAGIALIAAGQLLA